MKLTRILPKSIAIVWEEYHLGRLETMLEYHGNLTNNLEYAVQQARAELEWLRRSRR